MTRPSWIGQTLGGRYQIRELIGQGGMSAVYKADDPNLKRVVAVKLIHGHLSNDKEFVRRFEEEAAAVAQLRHNNIIQVYDFSNDGDTYYIVFEFVPGESLQSRLERLDRSDLKLPVSDIIHIGASVCDALEYAHRRGIIHRDIKPANVMQNVQGEAILMDFGIVKMVGGDSHTATGAVVGTARYMSPEQIKGEQIDARTDIYSMGIMLYEMASGRVPFEADSAMTLMMMHVTDPVPDLGKLRPDIPRALVAVINKALAKDKSERFQSAAELAEALRAIPLSGQSAGGTVIERMPSDARPDARTVRERQPAPPPPAPAGPRTVLEPIPGSPSGRTTSPKPEPRQVTGRTGQPTGPQPVSRGGSRRNLYLGGIAVAFIAVICIVVAGILIGQNLLSGDEETPQATTPLEVAVIESPSPGAQPATVEGAPEESESSPAAPTEAAVTEPSATFEPTPTTEMLPTDTPQPVVTDTATPSPTNTMPPAPTEPPTPTQEQGPFVRINNITVNGSNYVVDYTPIGYTPALPGQHVHFFFDTVPPENAGVGPTQETWFVYGGPNPFTGYTLADRPAAANRMCALVANPDHTIILNTGNCVDLPA